MDDTHALPSDALPGDPQECHRLLLAAYRQAQHLEQQVATSQQQAAQAQQEAESLTRVWARRLILTPSCNKSTLRSSKNLLGTSVGFTAGGVNGLPKPRANSICLN